MTPRLRPATLKRIDLDGIDVEPTDASLMCFDLLLQCRALRAPEDSSTGLLAHLSSPNLVLGSILSGNPYDLGSARRQSRAGEDLRNNSRTHGTPATTAMSALPHAHEAFCRVERKCFVPDN